MTTAVLNRSALSPAMREAVAIISTDQGMRGLIHGSTIAGLIRLGLAYREAGWAENDWDAYLTDAGLAMRDRLWVRVDELLANHGFTHSGGRLYDDPDEGGSCTRGAAMRKTGISW